ncbi:hypothetical protein GK047_06010 [Paenibacillus sp. SYP-B3998]|uniref:Uncharacterized protein n=1 Tax=Paenibacillus sp. SYP-B3998 TaxID=2678564 RepID=A0A6G3ZTP3_9BACL|nr:hypothetical protein [Paenibacillus sp. SYP-B3998]NEW05573.1 hypothetical protein [Paenibacillus sp. SYP-B3998]
MSMKAIELQFAVHKNDEAGIRQNQLMQKPRQDETILENQSVQTTERDSHRSGKLEESARTNVNDMDKQKQKHQKGKNKQKAKVESHAILNTHHSDHPYKGHHIDLSL